jgi:hypothetical protein
MTQGRRGERGYMNVLVVVGRTDVKNLATGKVDLDDG